MITRALWTRLEQRESSLLDVRRVLDQLPHVVEGSDDTRDELLRQSEPVGSGLTRIQSGVLFEELQEPLQNRLLHVDVVVAMVELLSQNLGIEGHPIAEPLGAE